MIQFDTPQELSSIIKVIGVGGGGSNAVNFMFNQGIQGVDFVICNTDAQALDISPVPTKIQLGAEGLGAGCIPQVGRDAAIEEIDKIEEILKMKTKMVFITAGMGGGTGTGAAPVIAQKAKELGILTVGIVTIPFMFEGRKKMMLADEGIKELRKHVDTLLIICNDKLRELFGNLKMGEAFAKADSVLTTGARGIAEIITSVGGINVDFNDVKTVMKNSGVAIMGSGVAEGENRAIKAIEQAMSSPLLNDSNIKGAKNILLYIRSGADEITMDEIAEITDYIQTEAGAPEEVIWGTGFDDSLGDNISITFIATGFQTSEDLGYNPEVKSEKTIIRHNLPISEINTPAPVAVKLAEVIETPAPVIENSIEEEIQEEKVVFNFDTEEEADVYTAPQMEVNEDVYNDVSMSSFQETEHEISEVEMVQPQTTTIIAAEPKVQEVPQYIAGIELKKKEDKTEVTNEVKTDTRHADELMRVKNEERIRRLRELSTKIRTQNLVELEEQPAFARRGVQLSDVPASNENIVSRFTLSEENNEGEKKMIELKQNNSFLHDNVD